MMKTAGLAALLALVPLAVAQSAEWGQCEPAFRCSLLVLSDVV